MKSILILSALFLFLSQAAFAYQPGEAFGKGIFLFQQALEEPYGNSWSGIALNDRLGSSQAEVFIRGEGSSVDFYGILSINCKNTKSFWISAKNFEEENASVVPQNVITNASYLFCN